ncbi:MAG TPA: hypothetical protein VKB50_21740 [Vicinamibacterales bacterium]|nr:hypothetical protein [Vicinamibacterales bacterium]
MNLVSRSSEDAAEFLEGLTSLAGRLSSRDLVVSRLHCDWASFGSWMLEAQRGAAADAYGDALLGKERDTWGPEVVRVMWDGREKRLAIATSPTPPLSAPTQWRTVTEEAFDDRVAALTFAEKFLAEWDSQAA